jgi:hypothetical protein
VGARRCARPDAGDVIRNVVLHLSNEQPLVADLFAMPAPGDAGLVCTNLRTPEGRRPIFVDHIDATFYFPYLHVRFLEIPPGTVEGGDRALQPLGDAMAIPAPEPEPEVELEIDEDFLRRVREA